MNIAPHSPNQNQPSIGPADWAGTLKDDVEHGEDRLLRANEVQRHLGVSRATAYRMMTDGTLPAYRFGGRRGKRAMVRVSLTELRAWISSHKAVSESPAHSATC